MIPLRDVIPSRTLPIVTSAIIIVNALVFLFEVSLPEPELRALFGQFGLVPAHLALPTVLTSMFLHGGWLHVIGNMWYLWIFGDNVEDRMGHARFLVFYLAVRRAAGFGQVVVAAWLATSRPSARAARSRASWARTSCSIPARAS